MVDWDRLFADRVQTMRASVIRDLFRLTEKAEIISFAGGFPGPESFPSRAVAEVAEWVVTKESALALQYGPTEGFAELRGFIAAQMASESIPLGPEAVLITNGSQQALDLLSKLFLNPGDEVIVELPGYVGGIGAFLNYQARPLGIPVDAEGLQVDRLADLLAKRRRTCGPIPKLAYVVPNFQNPTGVTLSLDRRRALVELAVEFGFLIIEDNPYGEIRFEGSAVPHIKSFDPDGHVVYLGSYSKSFLPGFRLGWVAADPAVTAKLVVAKQATDLCSGSFGQRVICECLRRGVLPAHTAGLVELYRGKRDTMLAALAAHFPTGVAWTRPAGGFFIWVTLPPGVDAAALLPLAVAEEGVAYVSGGAFHVDGSGKNTLRLAYSQADEARIEEGIARLGRFLRRRIEPASLQELSPSKEKVRPGGRLAVC